MSPTTSRSPRRTAAFTLIEVLAAVLLTSIVLTVAVSIFINISDATTTATERMRETRHAVAVLDRIAHDLESAFLIVKPAEMDPLEHPWIFLAESEFGDGADRLKFFVRSHKRRSSQDHSSDVAVVTYALAPDDFDSFDLVRSATPSMPERLSRDIPIEEEDGAVLLAENVASFSVRLMNEDGQWVERWDSFQLADSGALPIAAEIEISFVDPDAPIGEFEDAGFGEETDAFRYKRRVSMPMRPVPLGKIIDEYVEGVRNNADGSDGKGQDTEISQKYKDGQCEMTYEECARLNSQNIIAELGSVEAYEECLPAVPRICVEDWGARKICGVRVECGP